MNKRHKLLRRVFSAVMALVLAVSPLPTYAFAASVPTSTTIDGNAADFTGAWKSAHDKPCLLYTSDAADDTCCV